MINLVVAIPCEAKPLIQHLRLQKQACNDYALYKGEGLNLIVSGVGKLAAAIACAWLQGLNTTSSMADSAWLNIGIAGHGYQPLGSGFLAHRVSEQNSDRCWYPGFAFKRPCPSAALVTVDKAESRYLDNTLYDMEGAGFLAACQRFSSIELVHCFKVVSDNHFSGIENINEAYVTELISGQLSTIDDIIASLQQCQHRLAHTQEPPPYYADCLQRWHFTHYQRKLLQQLLWRRQALLANTALPDGLDKLHNAGQVLSYLQQDTDQQPVAF